MTLTFLRMMAFCFVFFSFERFFVIKIFLKVYFREYHHHSLVQSLSHVQLFGTPWTAAHQASLCITNSWSLLKPMSIKSVMPSNHIILCCPLLPPAFNLSQHQSVFQSQFFTSRGQRIGASASASVLPIYIQN